MIATVVVGDGRFSYLTQSVESYHSQVSNASDHLIMVNDEASPVYQEQLDTAFPDWTVIHSGRVGLAGALRAGWTAALATGATYILHLEEDFIFTERMDALELAAILERNERVAQVSLKRQAVNDFEAAAGGFIQCAPTAYWQRDGFIEHHVCYTFNPHLVRSEVAEICLSDPRDGLERGFTDTLLDRGFSFGIYGLIDDEPRVSHIGTSRSQNWRV